MPNIVVVDGRLTRDPEVKYTPKGTKILQFAVAVNRAYLPKDSDEWKEETHYFDVETFGSLSERLEEKLQKGDYILIEGSLRQDRWETKDGEKRSKVKIRASSIKRFPKNNGTKNEEIEEEKEEISQEG